MFRASFSSPSNPSSSSCLTFLLTAECSLLFRSLDFLEARSRTKVVPWSYPPTQTRQIYCVSVMWLAESGWIVSLRSVLYDCLLTNYCRWTRRFGGVCRTLFHHLSLHDPPRSTDCRSIGFFTVCFVKDRKFSGFALISLLVYTAMTCTRHLAYIFHELKCR